MARMHSKNRGKAGSKRPAGRPAGQGSLDEKAINKHIKDLAKQGKTASRIGALLRDEHQTPDVKAVTGKRVATIMKELEVSPQYPEDLTALMRKAILIRKHLAENKQDQTAKRGLTLTENKVFRLAHHYKQTGKLSQDWKYNPTQLSYLAE